MRVRNCPCPPVALPPCPADPGRPAADRAGLRLASCSGMAEGLPVAQGEKAARAPAGAGGHGVGGRVR
jgi:hypothetical protein